MSNGTKPDGGANLLVGGGRKLKGEVDISGSKNSAVALVTAAIIADTASVLENVPDISDIREIITILRHLGADVRYEDATHNTLYIDPTNLQNRNIPREFCDGFRASYYFAGSLLSKFLRAYVALPGGCDLGPRLFDQHEKAFVKLGSSWDINKGYFDLSANALNGCHITFDKVSVGATINAMLASVKANGLTVLENCAKEPHVVDV
ncbi:MAG: UDP-N-acetylglucosamine 1-carboxyvinyltransferase, partial [Oscillospiraceae bacterium]|nr:UDP-N-acetylglucosamine 1-carboxyvinyltransferase [Oscillospiraceae bacterium]